MRLWQRLGDIVGRLDQISYYELLDLPPAATGNDILTRYYELMARLHPDRFARRATPDQLTALTRVTARLSEARRVLCSPDLRREYDEGLGRGRRRAEDPSAVPRRTLAADPRHPLARKMYETARALLASGALDRARAHLELARGYEPGSEAIRRALAEIASPPAVAPAVAPVVAPAVAPPPSPPPAAPPPADPSPPTHARQHPRYPVSVRVRLALDSWERVESFVTHDISRGGMFIRTNRPFPLGTIVRLTATLPDGDELELVVEVVRNDATTRSGDHGVGVRFLDPSPATRRRIEQLLDTASTPRVEAASGRAPESDLSLESLVGELLRLRSLSPHDILGVAAGSDRDRLAAAYRERARRFQLASRTDDPAIVSVCKEIVAHLHGAHDRLQAELRPSPTVPGAPSASSTPLVRFDRTAAAARPGGLELEQPARSPTPRPAPPSIARESLSADVFSDLGLAPLGSRPGQPMTDEAASVVELMTTGQHDAAHERIAQLVSEQSAPPRLRAARHVALGHLAMRDGHVTEARRQYESALAIDPRCREAIEALRHG